MTIPARSRSGVRPRWIDHVRRWRGSSVDPDLARYESALDAIAAAEPAIQRLSDDEVLRNSQELGRRSRAGEPLESIRIRFYALAREAARRTLGQRPFDEQLAAALALDEGRIVEMQTGEGKTLAAVMPAALNALTGRGVHVLTFNDYLACRDARWMQPVYALLGISVGFVREGLPTSDRRAAYQSDVTYVTAKEAGFDHLRDQLVLDPAALVHRPFHCAIADEADSLLIDEATVPLVIAGSIDRQSSFAPQLARLVASLVSGVHFETDEHRRNVDLTDAGIDAVERWLSCGDLHQTQNVALLTEVNCALHARVLLRRDVDYIVRNGVVEAVDERTGRVASTAIGPMAYSARSKPRRVSSGAPMDTSSAPSHCSDSFAVTRSWLA